MYTRPTTPDTRPRSRRAAVLVLVVGLLVHAALGLRWIEADARFGAAICCDMTAPVQRLVVLGHADALPWRDLLVRPHDQGLMSWLAAAPALALGYDGDVLLAVQLGLGLLLQLAAWAVVRRLAGPWPAVLAALALPLVPGVAFGLRTWSPYPGQWAALLALTAALLASRSLTRPGPVLLALPLVWIGANWSAWITDDMLFVASAGVVALGAFLRGLILGRGPGGEAVARGRVLVGGAVLALGTLGPVVSSWALRPDMRYLAPYTLREMGLDVEGFEPWAGHEAPVLQELADPRSAEAISAYAWRLAEDELGLVVLGALAVLGLPWLLRGRGRAELLLGLLAPLVALSLLGKKQIFYVYLVLPFPLLVAAAGLGPWLPRGPWGVVLRGAAGVGLLAALALPWWRAGFSGQPDPPETDWERRYFQYPLALSLAPRAEASDPLGPWLADALPSACPGRARVGCLGDEYEPTDLGRFLAEDCVMVEHAPNVVRADDPQGEHDALLIKLGEDGACTLDPGRAWARRAAGVAADPSWRQVARDEVRGRCWGVWIREGGPLDRAP